MGIEVERLVKRLENVPLANIGTSANEIAWKKYSYIPYLVYEIGEKIGEVLGSNYVVVTPNLTIVDIEYRSWHSKTYCRDADCLAEEYLYEKLVGILKKLRKPKETKVVPDWKHYCGAAPIYHRYNIIILRMPNISYTLATYNGGRCWHAEYESVSGVYVEGVSEFRTDGCVEWHHFVNPPQPRP